MKFYLSTALMGLLAFTGVMASPVSGIAGIAARSSSLEIQSPSGGLAESEALSLDFAEDSISGLSKRDITSKFKVHVVTATARVIGIIIIDYIIHELTGANDENLTATFDKLTNVKTQGPIVAAKFENPTLFGHAQRATFDFKTSVVSGVLELGMSAGGTILSLASSTGVHLGTNVVAKYLHIFDENNKKVGTVNL